MATLKLLIVRRTPRLVLGAINAGLALGSLGLWVIAYAQGLTWRADFTSFYTGWSLVIKGLGMNLYD